MSLELEAEYFLPFFSRPLLFLRPLHYHAVLSSPGQGIFGAGAHSDYGMLTLLITDDQPGLQIHMPQHGWLDVPPRPGCFIVNLGDMLERWTNGRYRSTLHRERYSLAAFLDPNFDARVECLPQCCSADRPARYPPTTAGQHILDKYAATHAGFTAKPVPAEG
ncbi:oxygenase-like protein [Haematococcus lacustris]|uniref:Oxygenase-like protein n=1 Tax=Haematococcus lacustris TaxID=44745 RepID=A0A699ZCM3_HAELA|nr:oxygenase-like protein [Haematococcus lacustris]